MLNVMNAAPKRKLTLLALFVPASSVLCLAVMPSIMPLLGPRWTKEDAIEQTAMREYFQSLNGGWRQGVFCVSVQDHDPSDRWLMAFRNNVPPVVKRSNCGATMRSGVPGPVVEKQTRRPAFVFNIGRVQWLGLTDAEVSIGGYCGDLCGASATFDVTWDWWGGCWVAYYWMGTIS
jgi:hypothetical protein